MWRPVEELDQSAFGIAFELAVLLALPHLETIALTERARDRADRSLLSQHLIEGRVAPPKPAGGLLVHWCVEEFIKAWSEGELDLVCRPPGD